ncbi:hypothetical protein D5b_00045 [Faustovirus]|nr:hypothetical protein D5b_00045 [Faustovirus]AMN84864.1 hypothetical protein D6_00465 [Faustovirus]AMP44004.1 hypothetical protein PRJ_Dakar_00044 [Faustovirus]
MLCSGELIRDYLKLSPRDLITRILAGEEVGGLAYKRITRHTHKYVSFSYNYQVRTYVIDISCNLLDAYFTTVDNQVFTKQDVYETIFSHDRSYVSVFINEYMMAKLSREVDNSIGIASMTADTSGDIYKLINIVKLINLKVKFGKFNFGPLWKMERELSDNGELPIFDVEIDVAAPLSLNKASEISPKILACKYPLMMNGCKIVSKLEYSYDDVMWALGCIYMGSITTTSLSQVRIELLRDLGIDVDGIINSCMCFISNDSQIYAVDFY